MKVTKVIGKKTVMWSVSFCALFGFFLYYATDTWRTPYYTTLLASATFIAGWTMYIQFLQDVFKAHATVFRDWLGKTSVVLVWSSLFVFMLLVHSISSGIPYRSQLIGVGVAWIIICIVALVFVIDDAIK